MTDVFTDPVADPTTATREAAKPKGKAKTPEAPPKPKGKAKAKPKEAPPEIPAPVDPLALTSEQEARVEASREALKKARAEAVPGKPLRLPLEALLIVGLDVPDNPADPLTDPDRLARPLDPQWVELFKSIGWSDNPAVFVEREDGAAYVLEGRTRTRTARQAKAEGAEDLTALAVESEAKGHDQALLASMLNYYRMDDGFMDKARRARRLLDRFTGGDKAKEAECLPLVALAMRVGSDQAVRNWIALIDAPGKVQAAVEGGQIAASSVIPLLRKDLKPEHQVQLLEEALGVGDTSVGAIRARVKNFLGGGEDEEEGSTSTGSGPAPGWGGKGQTPKKRFVDKLCVKLSDGDNVPENVALMVRAIRWAVFGDTPPREIAGAITSLLNAEKKGK